MTDYEFEMMCQYYETEYKNFLDFNGLTEDEMSFDQFIDEITCKNEMYLEM